jgi:hypothetical protein
LLVGAVARRAGVRPLLVRAWRLGRGSDPCCLGHDATCRSLDRPKPVSGIMVRMNTAAAILLGLFVLLIVLGVLALFIWAAKKDGEEDDAVQRRLGIRRKTRLGR